MKFIIDAQLPRRLIYRFQEAGCDCLHTLDLPTGNRSSDMLIIAMADQVERIIVTKDADFVSPLLLHRHPPEVTVDFYR